MPIRTRRSHGRECRVRSTAEKTRSSPLRLNVNLEPARWRQVKSPAWLPEAVSLKLALWAIVIALAVYGIVLYARGDFA